MLKMSKMLAAQEEAKVAGVGAGAGAVQELKELAGEAGAVEATGAVAAA